MPEAKEVSPRLDSPTQDDVTLGLSDVDAIDLKIAENGSKLRQYQRRTSLFIYIVAAFVPLGLTLTLGAPWLQRALPQISFKFQAAGLITAAYALLGFLTSLFTRMVRISSMEQEIETLSAKRRILSKSTSAALPEQDKPTYFDRLVDINVTNLGQYYSLVKYQTNNSFLVSIGVGVFGFALISTGLILGFYNSANVKITYISTASG
jgi:hypothetical protein